jgi:hypothetical protein
MNFLELISKNNLKSIYLVKAEDQSRPVWYYLELEKLQIPIFFKIIKHKQKKISLVKYGRVIAYGWGNNPPNHIKNEIEFHCF